ncbi:hypothetical protein [Pusillimonas sp. T2]|nr:hypothetical protein [Pusillimonas sp. T2]
MSNSRVLFLATLVLVAPRMSPGVAVWLGSVLFLAGLFCLILELRKARHQ